MKYCISAKCTEVITKRGLKTWKTRVVKKSLKDTCPDCGSKLTGSTMHFKKRTKLEVENRF